MGIPIHVRDECADRRDTDKSTEEDNLHLHTTELMHLSLTLAPNAPPPPLFYMRAWILSCKPASANTKCDAKMRKSGKTESIRRAKVKETRGGERQQGQRQNETTK
ncbi:hypothetical protein E2P81_ATG06222 [Venturia nashicola]|uniref:Uncharacterized protein n=1 Tax=Venturia nashicola TaxID=86259 RepID=A0A4Z1P2F7_9PEZI|nr:hypothetical protein E6O75_ATG06366 [Venturia nashicola]TLD27876.1 hypothetical protein E2P81_ATG06222 [Venturia nashicola]